MGRMGWMTMSNPLPARIKPSAESDPYAGVLGLSVSVIAALFRRNQKQVTLVGNINLPALHGA